MDLFDYPIIRNAFVLIAAAILAGLLYLAFIGARALFRQARQIAREAGYREGNATWRAILRMAIWVAFFVLFYLFAFFSGKRLGWWALPVALGGAVLMIAGLLVADKLITVRPGDTRTQGVVGGTLVSLLTVFIVAIALAI